MAIGWARVLKVYWDHGPATLSDPESSVCQDTLTPAVLLALYLSFLELFSAVIGATRSKPHQVLLFALVRFGVQVLAAPLLPCQAWQHLLTLLCWGLGDTVRFSCFAVDVLFPKGYIAKAIRYTVGPIIFPFGATGEMLMVVAVAQDGRPMAYLAALLWPVGFYPLFTQLLKQRRKFFVRWKQETKDLQTAKQK